MKIIHRSILKELILTFLLGVISLNFLLMMEKLLRLSRLLSSVGASLVDVAGIILYMQPPLLTLSIPMSLLISVLITYGRLNMDNELTALKSLGMSFGEISRPVLLFGSACFSLGLLLSFLIAPIGSLKLREEVTRVLTERAPLAIDEGVFNTAFKDIIIYVREKPSAYNLKGIFVYDGRNRKQSRMIFAKEAEIKGGSDYNISFRLKDGLIHLANGRLSTVISFGTYGLSLSLAIETPEKKLGELTPVELIGEAGRKSGGERTRVLLELQRRLTLPSVNLLLMFLGPPLSLISGKRGRLGGLAVGLLTFAVYYAMLIYGENLASTGKIHYLIGAWAPLAAVGVSAALAFKTAGSR